MTKRPQRRPASRRRRFIPLAAIGAIAIVAGVAAVVLSGDDEPVRQVAGSAPASAAASASGVTVERPVVAMGRVPLNKTVTPTWLLHNTTAAPIEVGEPRAVVVQGCCPGPLVVEPHAIPPGGHATLTFPLQMHPGMDGPHEFRVLVPVGDGSVLTLGVTGDFR